MKDFGDYIPPKEDEKDGHYSQLENGVQTAEAEIPKGEWAYITLDSRLFTGGNSMITHRFVIE